MLSRCPFNGLPSAVGQPRLVNSSCTQSGFLARQGVCKPRTSVVGHGKKEQKNEGVYFEYEAVDPAAAQELLVQQEEEQEQFTWAQRSRDKKREVQKRHQQIDRKVFGTKGRKGKGRGPPQGTARGDGPVLASYSPVETQAMQPRAVTPEDRLLARPQPQQPTKPSTSAALPTSAPASTLAPAPTAAPAAQPPPAPPAADVTQAADAVAGRVAGESSTAAQPETPAPGSAGVSHSSSTTSTSASGSRRQQLLQRMKGGSSRDGASTSSSGADSPAAPAAKEQPQEDTSAGTSTSGRTESSNGRAAADPLSPAAFAAAAAAAGVGSMETRANADLRQTLEELAAQLPPEDSLPPDARQARQLLASILSLNNDDLEPAAGDVTDMLRRDMDAAEEYRQWARQALGGEGGAEGEALTEQEVADIAAALEQMELEGGLGGGGLDSEETERQLMQALGLGEGEEQGDGDLEVEAAMKNFQEINKVMAALEDMRAALPEGDEGDGEQAGPGPGSAAGGRQGQVGDLTDAQVLEGLRRSDPALYAALQAVPDLGDLDLDLGELAAALRLDDLEGAGGGGLGAAEMEALRAEAEALAAGGLGAGRGRGRGAGRGQEDEEEGEEDLDELLREMEGLGLLGKDGAVTAALEDDEEDEDDDEDGLGLGDLIEALDEDEELEPRAKQKAAFALQSMFNQPADELSAKGGKGEAKGADGSVLRPQLRGTTGMARGSVPQDDKDGGAAPPPLMPKPTPRRQ